MMDFVSLMNNFMNSSSSNQSQSSYEVTSSQATNSSIPAIIPNIKNGPQQFELASRFDHDLSNTQSNDDEVILSVYWKRGKLGAAYFNAEGSELHLLNDIVDIHPDFNNLKSLMGQVQPSQVITCGGLADSFTKVITELVNGSYESDDLTNHAKGISDSSNKLHFLSGKKKDLSYDSSKRSILNMRLGFEPDSLNEEDHVIFINSHIDLKQESLVMSLGMLLKFLEKYLPHSNLAHDVSPFMVLKHISLDNIVMMDEVTYKALQIFNSRHHPSAFKRNASGSREGLSVFGIFNRCKSSIGVKKMREIFTNPSRDIEELNARLDAIEFLVKPQQQHIVSNLGDCIRRIESVTSLLTSIYRSRTKIYHWKALYSSLYNSILVGQICQKYSAYSQLFQKISDSITDAIHEAAHYINRIIDFDESSVRNQFTVKIGIDNQLDLMRQTYSQVPDVLVKVAQLELEDLPEYVEECAVYYLPELGYLLAAKSWKEDADASEYYLPNLEFKFAANGLVYYKSSRCTELDNILGDIVSLMSNIESNYMVKLIQFVHQRVADIVEAIKLIAELDCVIALATVASENNYRKPVLTMERKLEIIKGRHPLQELCVDNFVPNDANFSFENGLIKILTGPNASGKSIYLKQIAIIAYLAHIGSFVPAQSATIGILDHIHSRIQTVETISMRMSAFLLDLKQMSFSLYNSTPSSLIVIDEFGKGTTEIDGLSLLAASLLHFIERKENCPFVIVSTHFHNLPSLLPETPLVHLQFMDYIVELDEIIYLHQIKDGVAGSSLTLLAAKTAGLSEDALKRSETILARKEPCTSNSKLKITRVMLKEIVHMKKIFSLGKKPSTANSSNEATENENALGHTTKEPENYTSSSQMEE